MSDQEAVSEHYSLDHLTQRIESLEMDVNPAIGNVASRLNDLSTRVDTACKAGDEGMADLETRIAKLELEKSSRGLDVERAIANLGTLISAQEKRIDLIADDDPYNPGELTRIGERISTLEARLTNEVRQLLRDIRMENDHRRSLIERVEGYARTAEMADKQLDDNLDKAVAWVRDEIDFMRDWSQEHTTSNDEWHATLSKQLTGAKIVLAAGGIAIAYLMGRSTR